MSFVLLGQQEPDELCVGHFAVFLGRTVSHSARENAVDHSSGYGWKKSKITVKMYETNQVWSIFSVWFLYAKIH